MYTQRVKVVIGTFTLLNKKVKNKILVYKKIEQHDKVYMNRYSQFQIHYSSSFFFIPKSARMVKPC